MTEFAIVEVGRTVRAAICGWAPTVRLVIVLIVITLCYVMAISAH